MLPKVKAKLLWDMYTHARHAQACVCAHACDCACTHAQNFRSINRHWIWAKNLCAFSIHLHPLPSPFLKVVKPFIVILNNLCHFWLADGLQNPLCRIFIPNPAYNLLLCLMHIHWSGRLFIIRKGGILKTLFHLCLIWYLRVAQWLASPNTA